MSIITKTPNIKLISYAGENYPPILYSIIADNNNILDTTIKNLQDTVSGAQAVGERVSMLEAEVDNLQDDFVGINVQISDIKLHNADQDTKINANTIEVGSLDARLTAVEDDVSHIDLGNIKQIEINVATNANSIQALEIRLTDDEDNLSQHAMRLDALDKAVFPDGPGETETEFDKINAAIAALSQQINNLQTQINANKTEIQSINGDITELQDNVSVHGTTLETQTGQIANLQGRMTTSEAKIIDLDQRVKKLEEKA